MSTRADNFHDDRKADARRYYTRLRHDGEPWENWTSHIDASDVSDAEYFDDFGNSFNLRNLTHLSRLYELTHRDGSAWRSNS